MSLTRRGRARLGLGLSATLLASSLATPAVARAWEPETHVGMTQRAAQRSGLDAWLRRRGLDAGVHEILALGAGDQALLAELHRFDPSFGASPDGNRAPALSWLLAGAVLEGANIDRVRNHFVDPRTGKGLDERQRLRAMRVRFIDRVEGLGEGFDGTGVRADRWVEAPAAQNPWSRARLLDELAASYAAGSIDDRRAALARTLVCAGAVLHVLEAVGAPANAHGDLVVNAAQAGWPVERWAQRRYGLVTPPASAAPPPRTALARFFTATDGTGLADEVARAHSSPGTLPPRGMPLGPQLINAAVDSLLPRIAAESAALLDFLLRGSLELALHGHEGEAAVTLRVGSLGLGAGELQLLVEDENGTRRAVLTRRTQGGQPGQALVSLDGSEAGVFNGAKRVVAMYRGVDSAGEPIVVGTVQNP